MGRRSIHLPPPLDARKSMVVQITPIRACNLRCTHCFISNTHKAVTSVMTQELYEKSADVAFEYSTAFPLYDIEYVLMGGELHLIPFDRQEEIYRTGIDKLFSHLEWRDSQKPVLSLEDASFVLISNLINMRPGQIDIFSEAARYFRERYSSYRACGGSSDASFVLGTSYEPDTKRFYRPWVLDEWKANIAELKGRGVEIGVALTTTAGMVATEPRQLLEWITGDLGCNAMLDHFAPYGEGKHAPELLPAHDGLADFLIGYREAAEEIMSRQGYENRAEPLFRPGKPLEQLHSRLAAMLAIDWDGAVAMDSESSADDQFSKQDVIMIDGRTIDSIVDDLWDAAERKIASERRDMALRGCLTCEYVQDCQGGFSHYAARFIDDGQCAGVRPAMAAFYEKKNNLPVSDIRKSYNAAQSSKTNARPRDSHSDSPPDTSGGRRP